MARTNRDILEFLFVGPLFSIFKVLNQIKRRLNDVATQAEIDALTQRVNAAGETQVKALGEVRDEIAKLKEANPDLDLQGLEGAVGGVERGAKDLDDVVTDVLPEPTPGDGGGEPTPNPTPEPTPEPAPEDGQAFDAEGNPIT